MSVVKPRRFFLVFTMAVKARCFVAQAQSSFFRQTRFYSFLLLLAATLSISLTFSTATASVPSVEPTTTTDNVTTQSDIQATKKQLNFLNDRPSTDPTPIVFDKGKPKYRIPRNYIANMSSWNSDAINNLITLRVTFPGFKPLTEETPSARQTTTLPAQEYISRMPREITA